MKAKFVNLRYVEGRTIRKQGDFCLIERYLEEGFKVQEERNGFWVLIKPARVLVTIETSSIKKTYNMKRDVCRLYGRQKISKGLIDRFSQDIQEEKISFELDSKGYSLNKC